MVPMVLMLPRVALVCTCIDGVACAVGICDNVNIIVAGVGVVGVVAVVSVGDVVGGCDMG